MAVINATKLGETLLGTPEADTINGPREGFVYAGEGNDTINAGADSIAYGEGGDDYFYGASFGISYVFDGGPGNDRFEQQMAGSSMYVSYVNATSGIKIDLTRTDAQDVGGGQGLDTLVKFFWGGAYGSRFDDLALGSPQPDGLFGGAGNDILDGGAGNDMLYGDAGDDTIVGDPASMGSVSTGSGGSAGSISWRPMARWSSIWATGDRSRLGAGSASM